MLHTGRIDGGGSLLMARSRGRERVRSNKINIELILIFQRTLLELDQGSGSLDSQYGAEVLLVKYKSSDKESRVAQRREANILHPSITFWCHLG